MKRFISSAFLYTFPIVLFGFLSLVPDRDMTVGWSDLAIIPLIYWFYKLNQRFQLTNKIKSFYNSLF